MARLKFLEIFFVLMVFTLTKSFFLFGTGATAFPEIPEFPEFDYDPIDVDALPECDNPFVDGDCWDRLVATLRNIGDAISATVIFGLEMVLYVFGLFGLVFVLVFATIPGAPAWLSTALISPYILALGVVAFKLLRSGSSSA